MKRFMKRNNINFTSGFCHRPEHNAKREYFEQHRGAYRQVLFLPGHRHRRQRERPVVEFQLERHVHRVHQYLLADQFDAHLLKRRTRVFKKKQKRASRAGSSVHRVVYYLVVKVPGHLFYLAHRVVNETAPFAAIVQRQPLSRLVLANERRRLHPGVGELQVLVQVVQACGNEAIVSRDTTGYDVGAGRVFDPCWSPFSQRVRRVSSRSGGIGR